MSCHHYRLLLAFRPDELAADDRHALDAHLNGCPACASTAAAERAADAAIRTAMLAVPVPSDLRAKLHAGVSARQGAAWRKRVGWAGGGVGLLAALAVGLWFVPPLFRTDFTVARLSNALDNEAWGKEQAVKEWLKAEGMPTELPEDFDFALNTFHGTERVGEHTLPVVVFRAGTDECRVFVLKKDRFAIPPGGLDAYEGSKFQVRAVDAGGWVFVIARPGGVPLETFLNPVRPAV